MTGEMAGRDPFLDLCDAAAVDQAVVDRAGVRGRLDRAAAAATWLGTLRDLAERQQPLTVRTVTDRSLQGVLVAVAGDHVVVACADDLLAVIALDVVCWVRPGPAGASPVASGDRTAPGRATLAGTVTRLLESTSEVGFVLRGTTETLSGTVSGFGEDVITVRLAGRRDATVYVPLAAVAELLVRR